MADWHGQEKSAQRQSENSRVRLKAVGQRNPGTRETQIMQSRPICYKGLRTEMILEQMFLYSFKSRTKRCLLNLLASHSSGCCPADCYT